jgi:hypothetical protein
VGELFHESPFFCLIISEIITGCQMLTREYSKNQHRHFAAGEENLIFALPFLSNNIKKGEP